jgi:hypothetical protein
MVECFSRPVVGIALFVTHCYDVYCAATDDEGAIAEPNPDQGMQDKLVAAWDCLQVRAALCYRLQYSSCRTVEHCCACMVQYIIFTPIVLTVRSVKKERSGCLPVLSAA